eukprot:2580304-Alexandrium_andersonii.AAC.1
MGRRQRTWQTRQRPSGSVRPRGGKRPRCWRLAVARGRSGKGWPGAVCRPGITRHSTWHWAGRPP